MAGDSLRQRHIPWCTLVLAVGFLLCQILVLVGTTKTAGAMVQLGDSTAGWAGVGTGLARALQVELDHTMHVVSKKLTDSLGRLDFVQDAIDVVLSLSGEETAEPTPQQTGLSMLQTESSTTDPDLGDVLQPIVTDSVNKVVETLVVRVSALLRKFFELIRPALETIGEWILKFGDKIQAGIDTFSMALDHVQKIFDQIMSNMAGKGGNADLLIDQTFGLFDASNTGAVTVEDLQDVARMYSITALEGKMASSLIDKYDSTGDGQLNKDELGLFIDDPDLPDLMPLVLRTYAKKLSEAGGTVGAARDRDEVALAVVEYIAIVCSKNMTKVGWVADRLVNGSLPMAFTADVMAQLCLQEDAPDKFTTANVGKILVQEMYSLRTNYTLRTLGLLSNTSFWVSEGFDVNDQDTCVGRVTSWVTGSQSIKKSKSRALEVLQDVSTMDTEAILRTLADAHSRPLSPEIMAAIPVRAEALARDSVSTFLFERREAHQRRLQEMYSSRAFHSSLHGLLGGLLEGDDGAPSAKEQTINGGQPAAPETLEFARWLANNATSNAAMMQDMCFTYTGESSSALASFSKQVKKMVTMVQTFLNTMEKYATPSGIDRLEKMIMDFEESALRNITDMVEHRINSLVNRTLPMLEDQLEGAAHKAGEKLGHMAGEALGTPLGHALADPLSAYLGLILESNASGRILGERLSEMLGQVVGNLTSNALGNAAGDLFEKLVRMVLSKGGHLLNNTADDIAHGLDNLLPAMAVHDGSLARKLQKLTSAKKELGGDSSRKTVDPSSSQLHRLHLDASLRALPHAKSAAELEALLSISELWHIVTKALRSLANLIPLSVATAKYARREVARLSASLDTVFDVLGSRGGDVFATVAKYWKLIWVVYFLCLLPLTIISLYYGFWSGGFLGGPQPLPEEDETLEPPRTCSERLALCFSSCSMCTKTWHDTDLCIWSMVILMQILVLVFFVVSMAFCILAAVKLFIVVGCKQADLLQDAVSCTAQLINMKEFLSTFFVQDAMETVSDVCDTASLLTCDLIQNRMMLSTILTTVFSLLGSFMFLNLIIDSVMKHEQARWRRVANTMVRDGKPGVEA